MQDREEIKAEISMTENIRTLVLAYEEISIMRMQKIRQKVLNARNFIDGLQKVSEEVHAIYARVRARAKKPITSPSAFSTLEKNGKTLAVLITPNQKLSGNLAPSVTSYFVDSIKSAKVDALIIGKVGRNLVKQYGLKDYYYVDLPGPTDQEGIYKIARHMMKYNKVVAFYGRLRHLLERVSTQEVITGNSGNLDVSPKELDSYIFEPSIEKVLHFFEVQIFTAIFKQKISESELATLGSRISAMEAAYAKTQERLSTLNNLRAVIERTEANRKQISRLAGISLWRAA